MAGDWKTVPTEATTDQIRAGQEAWLNDPLRLSSTLYRAMVAASPPTPAAEAAAWLIETATECGTWAETSEKVMLQWKRDGARISPLYLHPLEEGGAP